MAKRTYAPRVPVEQRRTQLLDAALDIVVTEGHGTATMDAVAERVGVTKPVVYGVFANRAELLGALLRREQDAALAQLDAVAPAGFDAAAPLGPQLATVLDELLAVVRVAPQRWWCVVMPMPDMPAAFHVAREHGRAVLHASVERRLRDSLSVSDGGGLDVEVVAHAVVALVETAVRLVLTEPDRYSPDRLAAALSALAAPSRTRLW